jgi:hypothetical protein
MNKAAVLLATMAILVAIIAHVVLMALNDHPASAAIGHAGQIALISTAAQRQYHADGHEPRTVILSAPDPVACFVSQPATLPLVSGISGIDLSGTVLPDPSLPDGTVVRIIPSRTAPGHPPAVRRALLQVYRN